MTLLALAAGWPAAAATNDIGKTVAVRGKAFIERGKGRLEAKVKSPIELNDSVATAEAAKLKLLFVDDSVLTLGEKSRMVVKDFVYGKGARGKSLFNLVDGKMRAVVGKTGFEVETPTAVAAARGTVILFELGMIGEREFTRIVCLEGTVEVRGTLPGALGTISLPAGMMVTILRGEALPTPATAPPTVIERLQRETTTRTAETKLTETGLYDLTPFEQGSHPTIVVDTQRKLDYLPLDPGKLTPPINQQPKTQPVGVNINIHIPPYTPPAPTPTGSGGSGF
jgi:hypothetical protein